MIRLHDVMIDRADRQAGPPILRPTSLAFGAGTRIGIYAAAGAGKSVIARVLTGVDRPDRGTVEATCRRSWPLGFAGYLHPDLTIAQNIEIVARLIGLSPVAFQAEVLAFSGLGHHRNRTLGKVAPTSRAVLAYACAIFAPSDFIVADGTLAVGDTEMQARCRVKLDQRLQTAGLIFLSRNIAQLNKACDSYFALLGGRLVPVADLSLVETAQTLLQARETEGAYCV